MPLTSDEIKTGISVRISNSIEGLTETLRTELRDAIWKSLGQTCSLNRMSYSKFRAEWRLSCGGAFWAVWVVDYELDDFGRLVTGSIGGSIGDAEDDGDRFTGVIEPQPPDQFRRETQQPIPQPQVIKQRRENETGITKSIRGSRKVGDL
jgi:hypothetical protein